MANDAMRVLLASDDSLAARVAEAWVVSARWTQAPQVSVLSVAGPTIDAMSWLGRAHHSSLQATIRDLDQAEEARARQLAEVVANRLRGAGLEATSRARQGETAREILKEIEDTQPDLVALGPRGRAGFTAALLGTVTQQVLVHCRVPLLVARSAHVPAGRLPQVIVLMVNGTLAINGAIGWLARAGWLRDTKVVLAGLVGVSSGLAAESTGLAEDITAELRLTAGDVMHHLAELIRPHNEDVVIELHLGHPLKAALSVADQHDADLLVVAKRPPQPGDQPFADKLARYASTSVLLVPVAQPGDVGSDASA